MAFIFIHLPMKMEHIKGSETSGFTTQTPGNYPKENILHKEHGESLRSRSLNVYTSYWHGLQSVLWTLGELFWTASFFTCKKVSQAENLFHKQGDYCLPIFDAMFFSGYAPIYGHTWRQNPPASKLHVNRRNNSEPPHLPLSLTRARTHAVYITQTGDPDPNSGQSTILT